MDLHEATPKAEDLRLLPYSELRKVATKYGITRRCKSEKLIDLITSKNSDCEEVFSTPAAKELNSSRKNKENKFDENQLTPLATPRRGTYSIETPASVKNEDISSLSLAVNTSVLDMSNVTVDRGSERKLRPRKVSFVSPAVTPRTPRCQSIKNRPKTPVASRTPLEESEPSKVVPVSQKRKSPKISLTAIPQVKLLKLELESYMESDVTIETNQFSPFPSKTRVSSKAVKFSETNSPSKSIKSNMESDVTTETNQFSPFPMKTRVSNKAVKFSETNSPPKSIKSSTSKSVQNKEVTSTKNGATPGTSKSVLNKEVTSTKNGATPGTSKTVESKELATTTPGAAKLPCKEPTSTKKGMTPNFRRIHQKAFDKMESIDDYQKRKLLNSAKKIGQSPNLRSKVTKAKSRVPVCSGIPFISSVKHSSLISKANKGGKFAGKLTAKENTPQAVKNKVTSKAKSTSKMDTPQPMKAIFVSNSSAKKETVKSKFDLRASLKRKLGYKPYTGPLKPLAESNNCLNSTSFHAAKEPVVNKIVKENRAQTRSLIRGVRTNKRFELQMKNRKLD